MLVEYRLSFYNDCVASHERALSKIFDVSGDNENECTQYSKLKSPFVSVEVEFNFESLGLLKKMANDTWLVGCVLD